MQILLGVALNTLLENCGGDQAQSQQASLPASRLQEEDTDQEVYMVAVSSLNKLIVHVQEHANHCKHSLAVAKISHKGHVAVAKLNCAKESTHYSLWSSLPQLPNDRYLLSDRGEAWSGV